MLKHIVTDLHEVYLREFEAQLGKTPTKPSLGKPAAGKPAAKSEGGGSADDQIKKQARQLVYDTRYKARREGIPLERAFSQALQNSSASAPVKELAKGMLFGGGVKEELELEEGKKVLKKGTPGSSGTKDMVLVTPAKGFGKPYRRFADATKKHKLRSNPQIQSVTGTSYGSPYEGEKKKGELTAAALQHNTSQNKAKKDFDGDGKVETPKQEWKGSRDKAIKNSIAKKPGSGIKEGYSNWREDLFEILDVEDNQKTSQIKENPKVNNSKLIKINPSLKETINNLGGELVEMVELDEKITSKTSKKKVIDDFINSEDPKFSDDSKKQRINRALGAWYGMHGEAITTPVGQNKSRIHSIQSDTERQQIKNAQQKVLKNLQTSEAVVVNQQNTNQQNTNQQNQSEKPNPAVDAKKKVLIAQQKKIENAKLQALNKGIPLTQSYDMEGEVIDERRREDKGKPRPAEPSAAFKAVSKMMGSNRLGVQPRGQKKEPGKKPPTAGEYGGPATPAQKIQKIRNAAKKANDFVSDTRGT
jgi:hypothetical protein